MDAGNRNQIRTKNVVYRYCCLSFIVQYVELFKSCRINITTTFCRIFVQKMTGLKNFTMYLV